MASAVLCGYANHNPPFFLSTLAPPSKPHFQSKDLPQRDHEIGAGKTPFAKSPLATLDK
jgi:hypothetical protein